MVSNLENILYSDAALRGKLGELNTEQSIRYFVEVVLSTQIIGIIAELEKIQDTPVDAYPTLNQNQSHLKNLYELLTERYTQEENLIACDEKKSILNILTWLSRVRTEIKSVSKQLKE